MVDSNIIAPDLREKSRMIYESAYMRFEKWRDEKNVENIDENLLLEYFEMKSKIQKPSSLWSQYSMLRSMISLKKNLDIRKFPNLLAFLKTISIGYQAKKPNVFTKFEIETFLKEADDYTFLLMKVVLIIGEAGGCSRDELAYLHVENVRDEGAYFRICIPNSQTKVERSREFVILEETVNGLNLTNIIRKYISLRPQGVNQQRFFTAYRNGKCVNQPVGYHLIGAFPKKIAAYLGLPNPDGYNGYRFGSSFCDGK